MSKAKLNAVLYHHRHGTNLYLVIAKSHTEAERMTLKLIGDEWEPEREEYLEVFDDLTIDAPAGYKIEVAKR